ncbi:hypothetical protein BGZ58_006095, partial [Dissophora ornata]
RALESLGNDSAEQVREVIRLDFCYLVYDNINFALRRSDQRSNNVDSFESGTTATIVVGEDPGEPDRRSNTEIYQRLNADDLTPDAGNVEHLSLVRQNILSEVLHRRVQSFKDCVLPAPEKDPLPLKKTRRYPLPSMPINQSSVDGNMKVLEEIVCHLKLDQHWFENKQIIAAGDLLTTVRIRSAKKLRRDDTNSYNKLL